MRFPTLLFAVLASAPALADQMPITDVRPLLVAAINSPDGTARGVMVGEIVELMRRRGGTMSPIEVDVRTVGDSGTEGCKRLEVTTRQNAVTEPGKRIPEDKCFTYRINFCATGRFPEREE